MVRHRVILAVTKPRVAMDNSVDAAWSRHPLTFLTGHRGDAIKVCVVVENDQASIFSGGSDQEIRHPSTPLTSTREHALHLSTYK